MGRQYISLSVRVSAWTLYMLVLHAIFITGWLIYLSTESVQHDTSTDKSTPVTKSNTSFRPSPTLRILVLTFNRAESLSRCLQSLNAAVYDNQQVIVEIHVDRARDLSIDQSTLAVAERFTFKYGQANVFVKPTHADVIGQWLETWKVPRDITSEIAVFIEDDITVSPYFARWLWAVHEKYDSYPIINGYTLQLESIRHDLDAMDLPLQGPPDQTVFLYPVLGSWGFSPKTSHWIKFTRWYRAIRKSKDFLPVVPGLKPSVWYKIFLQEGTTDKMWTMWHIYFANKTRTLTLYPNQKALAFNWKEKGGHVQYDPGRQTTNLMEKWTPAEHQFPDVLPVLDTKGDVIGQASETSV